VSLEGTLLLIRIEVASTHLACT